MVRLSKDWAPHSLTHATHRPWIFRLQLLCWARRFGCRHLTGDPGLWVPGLAGCLYEAGQSCVPRSGSNHGDLTHVSFCTCVDGEDLALFTSKRFEGKYFGFWSKPHLHSYKETVKSYKWAVVYITKHILKVTHAQQWKTFLLKKVHAISKTNIYVEQRSREKAFHRHNFADNQSQVLINFYQSTF